MNQIQPNRWIPPDRRRCPRSLWSVAQYYIFVLYCFRWVLCYSGMRLGVTCRCCSCLFLKWILPLTFRLNYVWITTEGHGCKCVAAIFIKTMFVRFSKWQLTKKPLYFLFQFTEVWHWVHNLTISTRGTNNILYVLLLPLLLVSRNGWYVEGMFPFEQVF